MQRKSIKITNENFCVYFNIKFEEVLIYSIIYSMTFEYWCDQLIFFLRQVTVWQDQNFAVFSRLLKAQKVWLTLHRLLKQSNSHSRMYHEKFRRVLFLAWIFYDKYQKQALLDLFYLELPKVRELLKHLCFLSRPLFADESNGH